jgi:precorrin-2 dehydrogenase/sirohydrochlorin ferrochelatase
VTAEHNPRKNLSLARENEREQQMERLFPLFLKLKGRKCLVVGAGTIGQSKIASLLDAGAAVQVVAPRATAKIQEWARKEKIRWRKREFHDADLADCFLVVAATSSNSLHKKIFRLAKHKGVLCNVVDVPKLCDFYYPAVVRRGSLQVAISTGGESPALAQRLRKELESQFDPEYADWVAELGKVRKRIRNGSTQAADQKKQLHELASKESFRKFQKRRKK